MRATTAPRPGPHRTVTATPALGPRTARRTTSLDMTRPDGPEGSVVVELGGRDVVGGADGEEQVVDEVHGRIEVDAFACVADASVDGGTMAAPDLRGLPVFRGWGRALASLLPPDRPLLASALEDLGGAILVSGYAPLRSGVLSHGAEEGLRLAEDQADICAGWARGGEFLATLATTGRSAVPMGPDAAPALIASGWHAMTPPAPHTVRRIRRLDVAPETSGRPGVGLGVQAHFRDSYAPEDGAEMVLHEYLVDATVDGAGTLATIVVDPRVLPWAACPGAIGSAQQMVGATVESLAERARNDLRGPATCTHLTSTIRSLADIAHLAAG